MKKLKEKHNSTEFLKRKEHSTWSEELMKENEFLESLNPWKKKTKRQSNELYNLLLEKKVGQCCKKNEKIQENYI